MSFSQQRPRGVALAKDPSERGLRGPFLVQGGGKRRLAGIFDPFQGFDWCAVIQKVSCPDDGAGGDSRRGEPYENITHHSFNSGTDDRCRSVAHNACQRLGLGLAFLRLLRLRLSVLRLCRLPSLLRLWFHLPGLWLWF